MKRLFIILVALFMFANVSFAQEQVSFFGVKFGASEQEVINAFKKHGLVIAEEEKKEGEATFLFSPAKQKQYINYFNHDWDTVIVIFSDNKFKDIGFARYFNSKDLAINRTVSIVNSKPCSMYEMKYKTYDDGEDLIASASAFLEDFRVYVDCYQTLDEETKRYYVFLSYYSKTIQTIQDELPPPPPDMDKYFDEDGNILPQYLQYFEDGIFIPEVVEEEEEEFIFTVVEESAMFHGGQEELMKYISENLRYPQQAREEGTQGLVYVTFVVERDGSLTDIKILRDIGAGCGEEAVRIVKTMPKWIPAKQRGKEVRMQYNLPVKFTLAE
ncbi:MAG: energy transducer TonB [Bacteroidales bacterium]|nr:energy transducer TonB [Bacteroidales bacterium]